MHGVLSAYAAPPGWCCRRFCRFPGLIEKLGGGDKLALASNVNIGAHLVDVSPLSTLGVPGQRPLAPIQLPVASSFVWGLAMAVVGAVYRHVVFGVRPGQPLAVEGEGGIMTSPPGQSPGVRIQSEPARGPSAAARTTSEEIDISAPTYCPAQFGEVRVAFEEAHAHSNSSLHVGARELAPDVAALPIARRGCLYCMHKVQRVVMGQSHEHFGGRRA